MSCSSGSAAEACRQNGCTCLPAYPSSAVDGPAGHFPAPLRPLVSLVARHATAESFATALADAVDGPFIEWRAELTGQRKSAAIQGRSPDVAARLMRQHIADVLLREMGYLNRQQSPEVWDMLRRPIEKALQQAERQPDRYWADRLVAEMMACWPKPLKSALFTLAGEVLLRPEQAAELTYPAEERLTHQGQEWVRESETLRKGGLYLARSSRKSKEPVVGIVGEVHAQKVSFVHGESASLRSTTFYKPLSLPACRWGQAAVPIEQPALDAFNEDCCLFVPLEISASELRCLTRQGSYFVIQRDPDSGRWTGVGFNENGVRIQGLAAMGDTAKEAHEKLFFIADEEQRQREGLLPRRKARPLDEVQVEAAERIAIPLTLQNGGQVTPEQMLKYPELVMKYGL